MIDHSFYIILSVMSSREYQLGKGFTLVSDEESQKYLSLVSNTFGEGSGTPLQYSCLETPMDGGAWWAAVHGVAKS